MKRILYIVVLAIGLAGCGMRVVLQGELDPKYAPSPADTVVVISPDNASITDRQAYAVFTAELQRRGFKVVDKATAKWVLGVGTHKDTIFAGLQSGAFTVGGPSVGALTTATTIGSSEAEYERELTIYCWLYPGDTFRAGQRVAAWAGTETTEQQYFVDYPNKLVGALLDIYGQNYFDDSAHVSRH